MTATTALADSVTILSDDSNVWFFALSTTFCIVAALLLMSRVWQDGGDSPTASFPSVTTAAAAPPPQPQPRRSNPGLPVDNLVAAPAKDHLAAKPTAEPEPAVLVYTPHRRVSEALPATHPRVDKEDVIRVQVVTVRARVTAYTAWDHRESKPEWADGLVAWYPGGHRRQVRHHPHGLATDWSQFPPGATFIRVPGYLEESHPGFPENFWVVDDKCGAARQARRRGGQPVIDLRFVTRYSAVDRHKGWGARELDVEVIFPADHPIPASLRPWVVGVAWHTYHEGRLVERTDAAGVDGGMMLVDVGGTIAAGP